MLAQYGGIFLLLVVFALIASRPSGGSSDRSIDGLTDLLLGV